MAGVLTLVPRDQPSCRFSSNLASNEPTCNFQLNPRELISWLRLIGVETKLSGMVVLPEQE